jgi:ADP-ribose pyrophosphatase YjhB (NUDIX family)
MPRGLTALLPIRPGEEDALRATLEAIGGDIRGRRLAARPDDPHIDFPRSRLIHFARFALLDDPDRGPGRQRLLFSSNHDGELSDHLGELVSLTSDMEAIWGRCEGYAGPGRFEALVRAHALTPQAFYIAFRDETVGTIHRALEVRRRFETILDRPDAAAFLARTEEATAPSSWPGLHEALLASSGALPSPFAGIRRALAIAGDGVALLWRHGIGNLVRGIRQITASLDRIPLAALFNRLTGNAMRPVRSTFSTVAVAACAPCAPLAPGDLIPSVNTKGTPRFDEEDAVSQNQLTLVTSIGPGGRANVEAVLALIDGYARRLAPPGSLAGISTIHFVRWIVFDEGRRLMMVSDYDGSWEAYIDEFAEMILSGLDAIWGTALGYAPEGARDLAAFKRFLRCHQVPAAVFYSAYPAATVLSLHADLALARAVAEGLREGRTREWLACRSRPTFSCGSSAGRRRAHGSGRFFQRSRRVRRGAGFRASAWRSRPRP